MSKVSYTLGCRPPDHYYSGIVAAFAASAPTEQIEQAIWASPWASGHYANGGHWSYVPVPVVESPCGTW